MIEFTKTEFTSEKLDIIGIQVSKKYNLPLGLDEQQIWGLLTYGNDGIPRELAGDDNYVSSFNHLISDEEILKLYHMFITLNPKLKNIDIGVLPRNKYYIVMGVLSRFNEDDIDFFINNDGYEGLTKSQHNQVHEIERLLGIDIGGYCPSPKTLSKIAKKLGLLKKV